MLFCTTGIYLLFIGSHSVKAMTDLDGNQFKIFECYLHSPLPTYTCKQCDQIWRFIGKVSKSIIFLVKSFWELKKTFGDYYLVTLHSN